MNLAAVTGLRSEAWEGLRHLGAKLISRNGTRPGAAFEQLLAREYVVDSLTKVPLLLLLQHTCMRVPNMENHDCRLAFACTMTNNQDDVSVGGTT